MAKQNGIDTKITTTEQLVKKMIGVKDDKPTRAPLHKKASPTRQAQAQEEDKILQSLDNLDMLLANLSDKAQKEQTVEKLGAKYGVKKPSYQQPFEMQ